MGKSRAKTTTDKATRELLKAIVAGMEEKKGEKIVCLDLRKLDNRICDYFIICEADNIRKVKAVSDSVEDFTTRKCGEKPWHVEGLTNCQWVLMDFVNVVVHVFHGEARDFYAIENLWADAEEMKI